MYMYLRKDRVGGRETQMNMSYLQQSTYVDGEGGGGRGRDGEGGGETRKGK